MKLSSIVKVINIFEKRIYHKNLFCTHQKIMYLNLKQNSHFIQDEINYIPWRKERLPTPVFWPGEFHGLYSPWGHKESDTTEGLSFSNYTKLIFFTKLQAIFSVLFLHTPQNTYFCRFSRCCLIH